jgi:hypothetical protein
MMVSIYMHLGSKSKESKRIRQKLLWTKLEITNFSSYHFTHLWKSQRLRIRGEEIKLTVQWGWRSRNTVIRAWRQGEKVVIPFKKYYSH